MPARWTERTPTPPVHGAAVPYRGRFAPSPTGPLHAGSLVAALASWLDARAHDGRWLVRIEDVDTPRCPPGTDTLILGQLAAFGLHPDEAPWRQSTRGAAYQAALQQIVDSGQAYPCACTRQEIEAACAARGLVRPRHAELVYPGTCRGGLHGRPARAWRFRVDGAMPLNAEGVMPLHAEGVVPLHAERVVPLHAESVVHWHDRRLGPQQQDVAREVGDFVLRRADGLWAYQLAVVVDDAAQGITHVVRGEDLADNTARQILLQRALGVPTPHYLHTPLVRAADGHKLSKQNGARALDGADPLAALQAAGAVLGLAGIGPARNVAEWLAAAVPAWDGIICGFADGIQPRSP